MREYRIIPFSGDAVDGKPSVLVCSTDESAVKLAKSLLNGHDLEVWEGGRLVIRLQSKET
jgi:hypothetical protein